MISRLISNIQRKWRYSGERDYTTFGIITGATAGAAIVSVHGPVMAHTKDGAFLFRKYS